MKTKIDKSRLQELAVYIIIWVGALVAPPIDHYLNVLQDHIDFDWGVVLNALFGMLPFLVVFWLHDIFVAPYILHHSSRKRYAIRMAILMSLFVGVQCLLRPQNKHFDIDEARRVADIGNAPIHETAPLIQFKRPAPPTAEEDVKKPPRKPDRDKGPATPIGLVHVAMAVMLCGLNVGVKFFFKSKRDEIERMETERHQLKKELEFLTYQISPHFFMNTLNNIHVLIDIDPVKAKFAVIELSKMLRYALYEGNTTTVKLCQEVDCIRHYIELMKLRFTPKVDIATSLPSDTQNGVIPPMLLLTFIENAFKHGISYRKQSFIHIVVSVEDNQILFACVNSIAPRQTESKGGVGLENVKKRMELIYKDNYSLDIKSENSVFTVRLSLPLYV